MEITQKELASKLAVVKRAMVSKDSTFLTGGVLIKEGRMYAANGILTITATLETEEILWLPRKAVEMIQNLPSGMVKLTQKEDKVILQTGSIRNTFQTPDFHPDDEPEPSFQADHAITVDSETFLSRLDKVLYAASQNQGRPVQCGVLLESEENTLYLVAVDGYRMAVATMECEENIKVVIPRHTVKELLNIKLKGELSIQVNQQSVCFSTEEFSLESRLLQGEFVDWKLSYPTKQNHMVKVHRKNFLACLDRMVLCDSDLKKPSPITLHIEDGKITATKKNAITDYAEEIPLLEHGEEEITISFGGKFLLEAVENMTGDEIELGFSGEILPLTLENEWAKAMVLPVRMRK